MLAVVLATPALGRVDFPGLRKGHVRNGTIICAERLALYAALQHASREGTGDGHAYDDGGQRASS